VIAFAVHAVIQNGLRGMLNQSNPELGLSGPRLVGAILGTIAITEIGIEQNAGSHGNQGNAQKQTLETLNHSSGRVLSKKVNHCQ